MCSEDKIHKVVLIILYDSDGRILLQQRTDDAPCMPGMWAFFGGGIDLGESPEEAVIRETTEELNYKLLTPKLLLEQSFDLSGKPAYMHVFVEYFCGVKSMLSLNEGKDWGWFSNNDIYTLGMQDRDIAISERVFLEIQV